MACCVSDAALVYYIMAGPDEKYIHGQNQPIPRPPNFKSYKISEIRFGVFAEYINVKFRLYRWLMRIKFQKYLKVIFL